MIKRLKYEEVDWQKYQNCLEQSEQYIFFAEKKYLDLLLHQNWFSSFEKNHLRSKKEIKVASHSSYKHLLNS
jgi:hypothetical protein